MNYLVRHISIEVGYKGLFLDDEAFASFVYYCLLTTIKKGTWRIGRNKKLVSQLFTPYDEGLALVLLENNAEGIRDKLAIGRPDKKKRSRQSILVRGSSGRAKMIL
jgi:hypothetical protein